MQGWNENEIVEIRFSKGKALTISCGILAGLLAVISAICAVCNFRMSGQLQEARKNVSDLRHENEELTVELQNENERRELKC